MQTVTSLVRVRREPVWTRGLLGLSLAYIPPISVPESLSSNGLEEVQLRRSVERMLASLGVQIVGEPGVSTPFVGIELLATEEHAGSICYLVHLYAQSVIYRPAAGGTEACLAATWATGRMNSNAPDLIRQSVGFDIDLMCQQFVEDYRRDNNLSTVAETETGACVPLMVPVEQVSARLQ